MKPKWKAASCWGSNPELLALSHQGISTELQQLDKYPLTYSWNVVWTNQITPTQGTQGTSTLLFGNNERVVENNETVERIVKNKIRSHDHHCEVTWSLWGHMITIVRSHDHHCVLIWLHNHSLHWSRRELTLRSDLNTTAWEFQLWVLDYCFWREVESRACEMFAEEGRIPNVQCTIPVCQVSCWLYSLIYIYRMAGPTRMLESTDVQYSEWTIHTRFDYSWIAILYK